jgi:hypothetical protein
LADRARDVGDELLLGLEGPLRPGDQHGQGQMVSVGKRDDPDVVRGRGPGTAARLVQDGCPRGNPGPYPLQPRGGGGHGAEERLAAVGPEDLTLLEVPEQAREVERGGGVRVPLAAGGQELAYGLADDDPLYAERGQPAGDGGRAAGKLHQLVARGVVAARDAEVKQLCDGPLRRRFPQCRVLRRAGDYLRRGDAHLLLQPQPALLDEAQDGDGQRQLEDAVERERASALDLERPSRLHVDGGQPHGAAHGARERAQLLRQARIARWRWRWR